MEQLPHSPEEEQKKPDDSGEVKDTKKRRRKTRVPLKKTVKKEAEEKAAKEKKAAEDKDKKETSQAAPEAETVEEQKEAGQETAEETSESTAEDTEDKVEQPESTDETLEIDHEEEPEYQGELLIDHTGEPLPSPEVESDEEVHSFEALFDPSELESEPEAETAEEVMEAPPRVAPPFMLPLPMESMAPAMAEASADASAEAEPAVEVDSEAEFEPEPVATEAVIETPVSAPTPVQRVIDSFSRPRFEASRRQREEMVTEEEANDSSYYAEKRGLSRGVVTGGLVGWLIGRRGKRAVEREAKAAIESRDKATLRTIHERDSIIERLSAERNRAVEATDKHLETVKRTQAELRDMLKEKWDKQVLHRPNIEMPKFTKREKPQTIYESAKPTFETNTKPSAEKEKPVKTTPEQAEDKPVTEETYEAPKGRRVETSAWHRIELDEKTGKAVETPSVAYGEAYKREQKQEKLAQDAAKAQTAAQVGMTLLYSGTNESSESLVPQEFSKSADVQKPAKPPVDIRQEVAYVTRTIAQQTSSPATWAVALAVVVLLFITGVL